MSTSDPGKPIEKGPNESTSDPGKPIEKGPNKSKDDLLRASPDAAAQLQTTPEGAPLSEEELNKVTGGKAKTADKAYNAMDAYIKS
jgi:bacteriocin-like protein